MTKITHSPPAIQTPGSPVEELLGEGRVPYVNWNQSAFIPLGSIHDGVPVYRPTVQNENKPSQDLAALADIRPKAMSVAQAQQSLNLPFEWRAFYGGSVPALVGTRLPQYEKLPPYLQGSSQQLQATAQKVLDKFKLSHIVAEVGSTFRAREPQRAPAQAPGQQERPSLEIPTLKLRHTNASNHWPIVREFGEAFQREYAQNLGLSSRDVPIPPLELVGTLPAKTGIKVDPELPLLERFGELHLGKFQPMPEGISDAEYETIRAWVKDIHALDLPRHAAHRGVLALVSCPLHDLQPEQIDRTLQTHVALGTLSSFSAKALKKLWDRYGSKLGNQAFDIRLDTHLKLDGVPYLILQQLLGTSLKLNITASSYSGHKLMRGLAKLCGINVQIPQAPSLTYRPPPSMPAFPKPGDPILILERGSAAVAHWLKQKHKPEDIRAALAQGRVRLISHNAGDDQKLQKLLGELPARRLNATLLKRREARLIGRRQIIQAAQLTREIWKIPIGQAKLVIAGAGLIGGGVADAALALGYAPENILVVDTDPKVRAHYAKLGCQTHDEIHQGHKRHADFDRAVVIHATTGPNFNRKNLFQYAKESMVISMVSGGRGFDASDAPGVQELPGGPPLFQPGYRGRLGNSWYTGYDWGVHRQAYEDRFFESDGRKAILIADAYPPNLLEEQWAHWFEITPVLVSGVVLHAMAEEAPSGILPEALDQELLDLYEKEAEHLKPRFQGYDEKKWQALLADFVV